MGHVACGMAFPEEIDIERPSPIEQLQVAFAVYIAREIVAADGILDIDEMRLLMLVFPDRLMRNCRFLGPDTRLTEAYHRAYVEAVRVLPIILDTEQKLELVTLFHRHFQQFGGADEPFAKSAQFADDGVQEGTFAAQVLRALRVFPDAGIFHFPVDFFQTLTLGVVVKDTP